MAEQLYQFDEKTARILLDVARAWRKDSPSAGKPTPRLPAQPAAYVVHAIEVTSATADSYGYPARIQTFDGTTWSDTYEECRAVKIGGGTLTVGFYPPGRLMRVASNGMHVYGVHPGGAGSTISVVTNVCPTLGLLTATVTDGKVTDILLDGVSIIPDGGVVATGAVVESREVSVASASDAECETNPVECCMGWECVDCECVQVPGGQYATEAECLAACCPVETDCCENTIPATLYATITSDDCACMNPASPFMLTYDRDPLSLSYMTWTGTFVNECGGLDTNIRIDFFCLPTLCGGGLITGWGVYINNVPHGGQLTAELRDACAPVSIVTCSPVFLECDLPNIGSGTGSCPTGSSWHVVITE